MVIIKRDERNRALWKLGIAERLIPGKNIVVRAVRLRAGKSYLERAVQGLCPFGLQCYRKDNPVSVEERSYKTDKISRLKRTAAVVADTAINDQVNDKNDTLQVE